MFLGGCNLELSVVLTHQLDAVFSELRSTSSGMLFHGSAQVLRLVTKLRKLRGIPDLKKSVRKSLGEPQATAKGHRFANGTSLIAHSYLLRCMVRDLQPLFI